MNWVLDLFSDNTSIAHAILAYSLVAFIGLFLGKLHWRGLGLGIGGVLFSGILISAAGMRVSHEILEFLRDMGLVFFVYMIGLQVGPSFRGAIRSEGKQLFLISFLIIFIGTALTAFQIYTGTVPLYAGAGILSGATTNTPSLGAAREALQSIGTVIKDHDPTLGYALSYPLGIVGTILTITVARFFFKTTPEEAAKQLAAKSGASHTPVSNLTLAVENENLIGLTIDQIPAINKLGVVISRFSRDGVVGVPDSQTKLQKGDLFLAVGKPDALQSLQLIVGRASEVDLRDLPSELDMKNIIVTNPAVAGKTLQDLDIELQATITRIRRGDVEFPATNNVLLNLGDIVRIVGQTPSINKISKTLGNSQRQLQHFQFLPVFAGIVLGVFLGSIPWHIPGLSSPLKLGLAGGPLLAALFMSRFRNDSKFTTYVPYGANLAIRELGIILFLSSVGLKAGEQFFQLLMSSQGMHWLLCGASITLVPLFCALIFTRLFRKEINYLTFCGICAGSMTDPPALAFATSLAPNSNAPAVSYATVYPFVMLMRILAAQVLVVVLNAVM